jgi:hypothetical protein
MYSNNCFLARSCSYSKKISPIDTLSYGCEKESLIVVFVLPVTFSQVPNKSGSVFCFSYSTCDTFEKRTSDIHWLKKQNGYFNSSTSAL